MIKLKKIPVKAAESEKEVITHQAEVSRHYDVQLTVHKLHDREDRELIALGRTQRIFTAEEDTTLLGYLEEAERVQVPQQMDKVAHTLSPKAKKDEVPEEASLAKKKIHKLPKEDKDQESIKLKPFEKSLRQDDKQQTIKLKKVPSKPQEPDKKSLTSDAEVTKHLDLEPIAHARHHRDDHEVKEKAKEVFSAQEEESECGHSEAPELSEAEEDKNRWTRTPKALGEEEPETDLAKKKIKKLPRDEDEQEMVKLKPFKKPLKPEATEPPKVTKESELRKDSEVRPQRKAETVPRDEPTAAVRKPEDEPPPPPTKTTRTPDEPTAAVRKPEDEPPPPPTKTTRTPGEPTAAVRKPGDKPLPPPPVSTKTTRTPDAKVDQEVTPKKLLDKTPKAGVQDADKPPTKVKVTSTPDKDKEQVALKHLTKIPNNDEKQAIPQVHNEVPSSQTIERSKEPTEQQPRDSPVISKKEKSFKPAQSIKQPSPPGTEHPATKEQPLQKAAGETREGIPQKLAAVTKKGLEMNKTPSLTAVKEKPKEEGDLKPVEQLKKFELKKTPSPKVDKPQPEKLESLPMDRKLSGEKVKRILKTVSPKDSVDAVALKKVPKKQSPEEEGAGEAVKPSKGKVPMVKEVSPGSVQLRKVPTQLEEEVFEEDYEVQTEEDEGEEEEVWGWELVPSEEGEDREEDGVVETPGMPGAKRGEKKHST